MLSQFGALVSNDFKVQALEFCTSQKLYHLVSADAINLPFRDEAFDAAVMFDVLEHLEDAQRENGDLYRVVKPGSTLVVTVPAFEFLWGRQDILSHHKRRYTCAALGKVLAGANFKILKLSHFNTYLFSPIAVLRLAYRILGMKRGKSAENLKSDLSIPKYPWMKNWLRKSFTAEKNQLKRGDLPLGVSIVCVCQKPA